MNVNQKTGFFALVIFSALFMPFCSGKGGEPAAPGGPGGGGDRRPSAMAVDVFIVKKGTVSEEIEVPGTILANESTEIHPEVSGRLVELNVSEGRYVTQGTLLARIYDGDLVAQLKKLQVQLEIAQKTEERQAQLLKIQGISQQDYDLSLLSVNNLKADIDITESSIAKTRIRAPYNGMLGLKDVSPGAFVTPQTVITTISQVNQLKLDFTVPEKYTNKIKTGQAVSFTVEGSGKTFRAKVMATESMVTENTRSLKVRALISGNVAALTPGAFAKVQLSFDPDNNALMVPSQAVIPQARGKKLITYKDGMARFVDVDTGVRDSSFVQITSGISAGDTVVITGLLSIKPDSKIEVGKVVN